MAVSLEVKRIVVLVISAALLVVSAISLFELYDTGLFTIILDILVIIGSIGGLIGAWRMDVRHLGQKTAAEQTARILALRTGQNCADSLIPCSCASLLQAGSSGRSPC